MCQLKLLPLEKALEKAQGPLWDSCFCTIAHVCHESGISHLI